MRALRRLWLRAWNVVSGRSGQQRLREEIEQHIALETADNIRAGMTTAEAHRAARIKFGPVEAIRESYHSEKGLHVMETILQNCIFALRMMRKSPGFTALAAITLALGIGATSAVFSLIQGVLLTPPPYQKPDQLVLVSAVRTDGHKMDSTRGWAAQQWMDWDKNATTLQGVAGYTWTFNFLIRNDGSQSMQGMKISREYLRLMGVKTVTGRLFEDSEYGSGPVKSVVLGYEFWQRVLGGDPQMLGKTIRISRWSSPVTVVGIMEPGVRFLPAPGASKEPNYDVNATVDLWIPVAPDLKEMKSPDWNVVARVRDGVTVQKAQQELTVLTAQQAGSEKTFEGFTPQLQTVSAEMNQEGQKILLPLLGAAALVLLIACGNVSALLLVRGLQRQQEYAIRIAMGMGRGALLRLIMTESLLLALTGGTLGVGLAFGAVTLFKLIAIHAVPRLDAVTAHTAVLGWGFAAAVLAAFIAGTIPALRVLRLDPMEVLKDGGAKGTAGVGERRLLRAVVVLQTSLTLALLVGAGLLIRTMAKIAAAPSGYDTSKILTMSVTEVQNQDQAVWNDFHHRALERVAAIPGVQYAAFAWGVPLTGNNWPATVEIEGQPPAIKESDKIALPLRSVTPDYFKLMGLALLNGRAFRSTDDEKVPRVAVVNKAFAGRFFSGQPVIGRKIWLNGRDKPGMEIVGEIADGRTDDLTRQALPEVYLSFWQAGPFSKHLVIRIAADPSTIVAGVEREVRSVDPSAAIENVKTLEQIRDDSLASRTFVMRLLVGFSIIGSVLTLVGIYGVLSLSVISRRRELAIRAAVGAQQSDLRRLIFNEGIRVIGGGVFFGVVLALISSQVLSAFLYEVRPTDPVTLLVVGLLFLGVGLLACWVPAWRAEKVHPIEALRYS
ncbi:ADOP family duplicated permease [Terriglobus sp. RCC_193]|uniref:ABC transporter permease n=1 Tax=Terriglobus sp. RCC_193 TaxID=3239218 RepID=UPI003524684D